MSRKQFGKRVTAILTAAVLGMSLGACGSGDEVSAGGRELSGAAQQNPEEKRADQGEQDETQKTTGQDEGTAEDLPGAGTGAADAAESKDGVSGNSAEGENADDMPTAPVGYGVTPENENPDLVLAIQLEVPYWFPAQLLEWEPEEDEELIFHKSTVPLAVRRDRERLDTVNSTQNRDTKVLALSIMNRNTSGNLPHGGNTAEANVFSYWQYVDSLVYWGGSSGEGLIVPPAADVVDAGHRNGVRVLGTVFMPQTAHGGKMEWLEDLLKEKGGAYPVADKLIQAARVYGFDGWFINQETEGSGEEPLTEKHADRMKAFLAYFKAQAPELELIYYDSMTEEGRMDWQNALTEKNAGFLTENGKDLADGMFLNFGWKDVAQGGRELLKDSVTLAEELDLDPYDLYAGIDLQSNGYGTRVNWKLFEKPGGGTLTSLGLYCPSWAFFEAEDMADFRKKENVLWVNQEGDPSAEQGEAAGQWPGISSYVAERTAVTSLPFVTNFSMGNGYSFFKNGYQISLWDWNNRSLSDILPTYRYIIENKTGNQLQADLDMEDAWYGGSSLLLTGSMKQNTESLIRLYSAALLVEEEMMFTVTARASGAEIALDAVLTLEDGSEFLLEGDRLVGADWTTVSYDMSALAGKQIRTISCRLAADRDVEEAGIRLGNITMAQAGSDRNRAVSNVQILESGFDEDGMFAGIRLAWDTEQERADRDSSGETAVKSAPEAAPVYYEIYRIGQDDNRYLAGVSNTESFYLHGLPRLELPGKEGEKQTVLEIVPVNWLLEEGTGARIVLEWPDNSLTRAGFTADVTLAAPGDTVVFRSLCSRNTEKVTWTLPGASRESAEGEEVSVSYSQEGVYPVSVKAENESGSDEMSAEAYIVVTKAASGGLSLLSQGAAVQADTYVNDNEAPAFAVDGDKTKKWCATGDAPHEITLDLGEEKTVSAVDISHAQAGGESPDMNTRAYAILVSQDGRDFTEVWRVTKNTEGSTHDAFAPVKARFVRLLVEEPTQGSDSAARIYEIEVYGLNAD